MFGQDCKMVCLATAHPAKFPGVIQKALGADVKLPAPAFHPSLTRARTLPVKRHICDSAALEAVLIEAMREKKNRKEILHG